MDKYESLGVIGEGSYGVVVRARHRPTKQIVAIKKFLSSEDDPQVKKIAMREIKMLKHLRHDNLVNLLEVFRRRKRLYLVFEFVDRTLLDLMEASARGMHPQEVRKYLYQLLLGIEFCHSYNIIHRDVKPENVLVSKRGVVKLCDFGFARTIAGPGEIHTDYVATRWYRAPELLVGDLGYGKAVDVWAVGCLMAEMLTGDPLFAGDSDIDQIHKIIRHMGNLTEHHRRVFASNTLFRGIRVPEAKRVVPLEKILPIPATTMEALKWCLKLDPKDRPSCRELLGHGYFTADGFSYRFAKELQETIRSGRTENPLGEKRRKHNKKKERERQKQEAAQVHARLNASDGMAELPATPTDPGQQPPHQQQQQQPRLMPTKAVLPPPAPVPMSPFHAAHGGNPNKSSKSKSSSKRKLAQDPYRRSGPALGTTSPGQARKHVSLAPTTTTGSTVGGAPNTRSRSPLPSRLAHEPHSHKFQLPQLASPMLGRAPIGRGPKTAGKPSAPTNGHQYGEGPLPRVIK